MAKIRSAPVALFCVLALSVGACSQENAPGTLADRSGAQRSFTDAEKKAARSLAIGASGNAAKLSDDPFDRAVRCSTALGALREQFENSGISDEQAAVLVRAQRMFEQRARAEGLKAGHTERKITTELLEAAETKANISDEARTALACVRQLQQ